MIKSEELVQRVTKEQVFLVKKELLVLYEAEVFARHLYFRELQRFEGVIFETVKWLLEQEEKHAFVLGSILTRFGIKTEVFAPKIPRLNGEQEAIKFDIEREAEAMKLYNAVIPKATGELKQIFQHFRDEEIVHIQRLKDYLSV